MAIENEIDISAFNRGDDNEYTKVYNKYKLRLSYFARNITQNKEEVKDIVQAIFEKLHNERMKRSFESENDIRNFLYTIAKRDSLNYLRHQKVVHTYAQDFRKRNSENQEREIESKIVKMEIINDLFDAIDRLPDSCREIYELKIYAGLKQAEIAKKLDRHIGNVRQQISIARKKLKRLI